MSRINEKYLSPPIKNISAVAPRRPSHFVLIRKGDDAYRGVYNCVLLPLP